MLKITEFRKENMEIAKKAMGKIIEEKKNVLIVGQAGCGKTQFLKSIIDNGQEHVLVLTEVQRGFGMYSEFREYPEMILFSDFDPKEVKDYVQKKNKKMLVADDVYFRNGKNFTEKIINETRREMSVFVSTQGNMKGQEDFKNPVIADVLKNFDYVVLFPNHMERMENPKLHSTLYETKRLV